MRAVRVFLVALASAAAAAPLAWADELSEAKFDNWHRWRGPLASGEAPRANPPLRWSADQNIQWKVAIPGQGSATPIVWKDRIYLLTAIDLEPAQAAPPAGSDSQDTRRGRGGFGNTAPSRHQFVVLCLDLRTGATIWQDVANETLPHEGHHRDHDYASASPTTDGQRLYCSFGSRGIYAYSLDGRKLWARDLGQMHTRNGFGEGASPTIHDGTLVVNWDHEEQSFITALDAATGETRWKVDRDELTTWNTPLVVEHNGTTQVIVNATNRARSYDLADGSLLWECGGQASNPVPSTVTFQGLALCTTGYRGSALYAVPLDSRGDITDTDKIAWSRDRDTPYVPSPLLYEGLLYFTKSNFALLTCVDAATGKPFYEVEQLTSDRGSMYASPVAAAGRVYLTDRYGTTCVVKHGPEFEILATNVLGEPVDASPALVGNRILVRGRQHLYCIGD